MLELWTCLAEPGFFFYFVSTERTRSQFQLWTSIRDHQIARFTSENKEIFPDRVGEAEGEGAGDDGLLCMKGQLADSFSVCACASDVHSMFAVHLPNGFAVAP